MRSIKISVTLILAAFCVFCFSIGTFILTTAKAADTTPTTFTVMDNASIRLFNNENGAYGIRFRAYVGDDAKENPVAGRTYKMAIVPTQLIDLYENSGSTDNTNIVEYLEDFASKNNGSIATATCTPDSNGYITAAITDIYWINLNRDFSAIAYYEVDGEKTVATLAGDGARSIVDVADAYLKSGEATVEDEVVLNKFIDEGKQQLNNIVISSAVESSFFELGDTYEVTGDIVTEEDTEKGNAWKFTFKTKVNNDVHVELMYDNTLLQNRINGYDTVKFSVYSPKSGTLYACKNAGFLNTVTSRPLPAGWTDLYFSAKDIASAPYFIITYPELDSSYYITDFKAYTTSEAAEQVFGLIDGLNFSDEYVMFHGNDITEARNAYNALSEKAKALVTNYSQLQEIETLYANYVVLADMSSTGGFTLDKDMGCSGKVVFSSEIDSVYKNYLKVNVHTAPTSNDPHLVIQHNLSTSNLADCEKVVFYIYNGGAYNRDLIVRYNDSWDTSFNDIVLKAGEWNKIELTIDEFTAISKFGIATPSTNGVCEYKVSMIYAVKSSLYANEVVELINELPTNTDLVPFYGDKISAAKEAYDNLSDSAKDEVKNYSVLESAVSAYQNVVVLADMSSKTGFAAYEGMGNSSWINTGYDETYRNYLSVNVPSAVDANLALTFSTTDLATKLEGCEKVYFYVYSPCTYKDRELLLKINGSYNAAGTRPLLAKQAWTKVELSVEDFMNLQAFGVYSGQNDGPCEYKFSQIYAVKVPS